MVKFAGLGLGLSLQGWGLICRLVLGLSLQGRVGLSLQGCG